MRPEQRTLGKTGFEMTAIGLGAGSVGGSEYRAVSETRGRLRVDACVDQRLHGRIRGLAKELG